MPTSSPPAKGTQPEGAQTEADASRKVREMFTQIAPRYDLLNHLLSFQMDRLWRARVASCLRPILEGKSPLFWDLCCGTGDLGIALAERFTSQVVGADFALPMLARAKEKSETLRGKNLVELRRPKICRSRRPPSPLRRRFLWTLSPQPSAFRNLANYESGLREIHRILKPGGTIAILEFTEPPDNLLGNLYRWYFRTVLPRIGGWLSGDPTAYTYLPQIRLSLLPPPRTSRPHVPGRLPIRLLQILTFATVALHTALRR